jgi:hypothetical protein
MFTTEFSRKRPEKKKTGKTIKIVNQNFTKIFFFKGLVAGCHSFCLFFIFFVTYIHSFIQSHSYNTFIHHHSLGPLSISSSLESSVGRSSLWCRAENRTRALQQADALPTEPRRTITEPRRTIYKILTVPV